MPGGMLRPSPLAKVGTAGTRARCPAGLQPSSMGAQDQGMQFGARSPPAEPGASRAGAAPAAWGYPCLGERGSRGQSPLGHGVPTSPARQQPRVVPGSRDCCETMVGAAGTEGSWLAPGRAAETQAAALPGLRVPSITQEAATGQSSPAYVLVRAAQASPGAGMAWQGQSRAQPSQGRSWREPPGTAQGTSHISQG